MKYEWDEVKNQKNLKKHKISFEDAIRIFADPMLKIVPDTTTNTHEEVYLAIGSMSDSYNVLLVAHTYRDENGEDITRIISARKLSKGEVKQWQ